MRRESSQPVLLSTVALFPMWEIIRPGGAEVNLPLLPDDLIETVRQLNHDGEGVQWAMGDLLVSAVEELGPLHATHPGIGSLRRARTYILRALADRTGVDESTLRDRQSVCNFFNPAMRQ